jgi:DnaJ-class molecular chaperone
VLSNPKKRTRYDEYGDDGEGDAFKTDEWLEAYDFYRSMHPEVTKQDYKSFAERYYGSAEEQADLIEFYNDH